MQRLGIYAGAVNFSASIEERISAIKEAGFTCVCLDFEKEMEQTETSWENQVFLAQKYGLPVENAHLTGLNMNAVWTDSEDGEFVANRLIDELKGLKDLGVPCGVAHVTWGFGVTIKPNELALKRYEKAVNIAEKYGVKLALENSVYAEHLRYLLDNIKSPYLGFCYDSGHENAFAPQENFLSSYGDRLFAMHLHDNCGDGKDEHKLPFEGTIDWTKTVKALNQTELFKRSIVLESGSYGKNLKDCLQKAYAVAMRLATLSKEI